MVRPLGFGLVALLTVVGCAASGDDDGTAGRFDDQTAAPARDNATPDPAAAQAKTDPAAAPATPTTPAANPDDPKGPVTPIGQTDTSTCRAPHDLGSMSGDSDAGSTTATGNCSGWYRIRMTENNTGALPGQMKITATLLSPAGENFDLYLHVNADTDVLECTEVAAKSEAGPGHSDVAKTAWGEYYSPNFGDDSRYVSIEIKNRNGSCSDQPWSLVVQGNY